ncbi:helix-turn-helix domain-containing protein [Paenibacillus thailandensis]|uniref:Helix-turn-helix domain-containing protein n=1 Tax=Paenibacillus thailandensis TaxID=393250 RepID=A0ABW5R045_9BACL
MAHSALSLYPALINYVYWKEKQSFLYEVDTYEDWVMFAVEEGAFAYGIDGEEGTAARGEAVICPPGVPFRRRVLAGLTFHFITFSLKPVADGAIPDNLLPKPGRKTKFEYRHSRRQYDNFAGLVSRAGRTDATEAAARHWANHLLSDIWLTLWTDEEAAAGGQETTEDADELMAEASAYIRRHAFGEMSMKRLADELGLSQVQLTRRYRRAYGMTPSEHLASIRLDKARALLMETDLPLERIARECGYENGFYLSRVFSKKMKISPSEFRKLNRL